MSKGSIIFPDLIELNDYGGSYDDYEDALLEIYEADLWKGNLTFNGLNVRPKVHKRFECRGKILDWTFAHFTSSGTVDEDRELDLRRCERIGYINPIIKNAHLDCVKVWENERNGKKSIVLWCEEANAKVVLSKVKTKKGEYYVVTTFYLINTQHRIDQHNDEYKKYVKTNGEFKVTTL